MAARQRGEREQETTPTRFPETTPALTRDDSFTLQAVMDMQKTLGGVAKQIDSLDARVSKMSDEVSKHGKWIFAANVVLLIALGLIGFFAKVLWDIAKVKFGLPP
jgi:hypothetical protein